MQLIWWAVFIGLLLGTVTIVEGCCWCGCGDCNCACLLDTGICRPIPSPLYVYWINDCTKHSTPKYVDTLIQYPGGDEFKCCWEGSIVIPGKTPFEGNPQCQCQGVMFPFTITMCCSEVQPSGECAPGPCQNCAAWLGQLSVFLTGGVGVDLTPIVPPSPCQCQCNPFLLKFCSLAPGPCTTPGCLVISEVQLTDPDCCNICGEDNL